MIDDIPVHCPGHTVQLHGVGLVDGVEQRREGVAQTEAAATSMADVIDALEFGKQVRLVVEAFAGPVQRMACRGLETPLALALC